MKLPRLHRSSPNVAGDAAPTIAEPAAEGASNVPATLDKPKSWMRMKRPTISIPAMPSLPKGKLANLNPLGSIEFAVRNSVQQLGAKRVADILGVGEWTLYKGCNPNDATRKLPDLSWQRILDLAKALRREGHAEFFSAVIQTAAGEDLPQLEHFPTVHHALSAVSASHGEVARLLLLATDPDQDGAGLTPAKAAVIAEAIEQNQEALKRLLSQVLAEGAGK